MEPKDFEASDELAEPEYTIDLLSAAFFSCALFLPMAAGETRDLVVFDP